WLGIAIAAATLVAAVAIGRSVRTPTVVEAPPSKIPALTEPVEPAAYATEPEAEPATGASETKRPVRTAPPTSTTSPAPESPPVPEPAKPIVVAPTPSA